MSQVTLEPSLSKIRFSKHPHKAEKVKAKILETYEELKDAGYDNLIICILSYRINVITPNKKCGFIYPTTGAYNVTSGPIDRKIGVGIQEFIATLDAADGKQRGFIERLIKRIKKVIINL